MNHVSHKIFIAVAGVALLLAGCTKKPIRPSPQDTMLGPNPGGSNVTPTDVTGITSDPSSQLTQRTDGISETEDMIRGKLGAVYFEFNESNIKPSEREKLQAAAKYLKDTPAHRLLLEGHCDWRGTAEYNLGLGDRRANAAKAYLIKLGVAANRIETLSKGSLDAAKNADAAAMVNDRRAEIVILKK